MTVQTNKSPIVNPEPMPTPIPSEETTAPAPAAPTPPAPVAAPTSPVGAVGAPTAPSNAVLGQNDLSYIAYEVRQQQLTDVEGARVRAWAYFAGAYLTGPVFPLYIATRTKCWSPFWISTALGVLSLPFAFLDATVLSSIPAAGLGTYLMAEKSKEKRRKLNIITPEQADVMKFTNF